MLDRQDYPGLSLGKIILILVAMLIVMQTANLALPSWVVAQLFRGGP